MTTAVILQALFIFALRLADVSIGTLRISMLVRGYTRAAGILSFVEAMLWLSATAQVIASLDAPVTFVAFAAGYAVGTMLGSTVERWLAVGKSLVRIVAPVHTPDIAAALRDHGFLVTAVNAEGRDGNVRLAFTVIPKRRRQALLDLVNKLNPKAFVTVEDIALSSEAAAASAKPSIKWRASLLRR